MEETMDVSRVTRVELVDHSYSEVLDGRGRVTALGVTVQLSLQDDGQTLKIFFEDSPVSAGEVREAMRQGLAEFVGRTMSEDLPQYPDLLSEDVPPALRRQP